MITSLIADDEAPARAHLIRLLSVHPDVQVMGEASNGLEALEQINAHRPSMVFLDIEMPGLSGFDVLSELSAPPIVVFATAFDEYAVRAFEANAIDYLLKPVQAGRLAQTLNRVRATLRASTDGHRAALRQKLATVNAGVPTRIVGRRGARHILLSPKQNLYATIDDQLTFKHTTTER
jgi:two-component system LytT family response regulator